MKLRYLQTSQPGVKWLKKYYRKNPQLNLQNAVVSLQKSEQTLRDNSHAGERFEDRENVRELPILGTAFSLLYTVTQDTIWIIDIRDQRGYRSAEALKLFNRELRLRYGIS